jgi:hypothetical protein
MKGLLNERHYGVCKSLAGLRPGCAIALAALVAAPVSHATVINFVSDLQFHLGSASPCQEAGHRLANSAGNGEHVSFWWPSVFNAHGAVNQNSMFFSVPGVTTMALKKVGGGVFNFRGIEGAEWHHPCKNNIPEPGSVGWVGLGLLHTWQAAGPGPVDPVGLKSAGLSLNTPCPSGPQCPRS